MAGLPPASAFVLNALYLAIPRTTMKWVRKTEIVVRQQHQKPGAAPMAMTDKKHGAAYLRSFDKSVQASKG
jgi:hypothetical protein